MGFPIFERHGKHVSLTLNGQIVVRKAEILLAEARELLELSLGLNNSLEGELRIGVIPTLGPYLLPLILKSLKSAYPKVQISLFEEPTRILEEMLMKRELDTALTAPEPRQQILASLTLFFEHFILACPKVMKKNPDRPVPWSAVLASKLVLLSEEHCLRDQTMALCDRIDRPGHRVASSLEMLRQMVALGEGAALFPALSVSGPDRFGGLATLHPIGDGNFQRNIRLVWRNSDPRSEYLKQFGKFISSQMEVPAMTKLSKGRG